MRARVDLRAVSHQEDGFTLPELLIASVLGLVAIGTVVMMFASSNATQAGLQVHDDQVQQARTTAEGIVREVRQASTVSAATPSSVTMVTYVHRATCGGAPGGAVSIACQVTYSCSGASPAVICSRTERNKDGSGTPSTRQVVSGLASANVFCYAPSTSADPTTCGTAAPGTPSYVGVSLTFAPKSGQAPVTVDDGAALANIPPPPPPSS